MSLALQQVQSSPVTVDFTWAKAKRVELFVSSKGARARVVALAPLGFKFFTILSFCTTVTIFTMKSKRSSVFVHWVAIIAVLMSSLAPTISQALAFEKNDLNPLNFVCSVAGTKAASFAPDFDLKLKQSKDSKDSNQGSDHQVVIDDHCPYCAVQGSYVLPLKSELNFELPQHSNTFPALFYQAPKLIFAWVTLPSRAPPAIS